MELPTYAMFGERVGIPTRGPWAPVLDTLALEETNKGLSDITFLIVRRDTGYPGQIGFVKAKKPTQKQRDLARHKIQEVIDKYNPGTRNPYQS
jgi:hypothetical protein